MVERIFEITKHQFQIFKYALKYSLDIQNCLIFAIITLHNFIYSHQLQEDIYDWEEKLVKKKSNKFRKYIKRRYQYLY